MSASQTVTVGGKTAKKCELCGDYVMPTNPDMELESLRKFKAYVHKRLDDAGIPADPESPHRAEGCRIGGRLDIVLAWHSAFVPHNSAELLSALKICRNTLFNAVQSNVDVPGFDPSEHVVIKLADAEIAKAEGQAL